MKLPRLRKRTMLIATAIAVVALLAWTYRDHLDRESISRFGEALPAPVFLAAFLVLPLVGFPISILLVLAGIRFGFAGGMAVATVGVFFHNLVAFRATHSWFRTPLRRRLERSGRRIPDIKHSHQVWFTALFAAIHGPPYAMKLYLLALTDIPFRIYFWIGAPIYLFFCLIPVAAGSAVSDFDPKLIYFIAAMTVAILAAGLVIRKRWGKRPQDVA